MIHDSYGTHAADSVALAATLRRAFVECSEARVSTRSNSGKTKSSPPCPSRCWRSFRTFLSCPLRAIWMSAKSPIPPSFSLKYQKSYFS
ncbi:MAG: hypothetical protein ACLSHC_06875 [Bilophila wadsworthia]